MVRKVLLGSVAIIAIGMVGRAGAADAPVAMPIKPPAALPASSWTGTYVGGHYGWGLSRLGVATNAVPGEAFDLPAIPSSGMLAGFQIGYNHQFTNNVVLGLEADVTFADYFGQRLVTERFSGQTGLLIANLRYFGTVRGRAGYAFGRFLPYVTGGLAWSQHRIENDFPDGTGSTKSLAQFGWTIGAGAGYAFDPRWSAFAQYDYLDFGTKTYGSLFLDETAQAVGRFHPSVHVFKVGLNYKLTDQAWSSTPALSGLVLKAPAALDGNDWSIHGQSTFIEQGYPSFRSPYQGPNSLPGFRQARNTITATAFIGRSLWEGAELYFNPEIDQGFGLSDTLGLGGFPNGEAQKSNYPVPHPNAVRLFLRQTFGLGGEQERVEDGPNQIAGKRDVSRVTVTVGKVAVVDIFDDNAYSHDPRGTFLNWAIWEAGAFDYPGDRIGLTWGAVAELNQKDWAFRVGTFLEPHVSNTDIFDAWPKRQGSMAELELRYSLFEQPGKLRLIGWVNRTNSGDYRETLDNPALNLDISRTRRTRTKYGFVANVEQALTGDLGLFSRLSWNDGRNEIMSFTDIDASLSLGAVLKGTVWRRPDDRIGVAGAVNALSAAHRDFIAAGGLGILIGDGRLNYRQEKILEAYYAIGLAKWATLTLDYQLIVNPAYNADRGPISIYATRLHAEF